MNNNMNAGNINGISDEGVYKRFVDEFSQWCSTGKTPFIASLDLGYAFDLQRERLRRKGVTINSVYNLRGGFLDDIGYAWSLNDPGRYKSQILYRSYVNMTEYKIGGKTAYRKKEKQILYLMVTRLENQNVNLGCCCPSCGAVSDIRTLLMGCPNCGTRFIMDDLFPKVTNFFVLPDYAETKTSISHAIKKWVLAGMAIGAVIGSVVSIFNGNYADAEELITSAFINAGKGLLFGAFGGYIGWAIAKLAFMTGNAAKNLPYLAPNLTARKKLPELMASIDKNFSYEYFVGTILSLLKTMIFCDDYQNLAIYEGAPIQNTFKDIIDVQYKGGIKLNSFEVKGQYCYVGITVYTTAFYEKEGKITQKAEQFNMTVCQNINSLANTNFSIKSVVCKGCGGSFDATREHNCPYCGNAYHLGDDDWVVLSFHKE